MATHWVPQSGQRGTRSEARAFVGIRYANRHCGNSSAKSASAFRSLVLILFCAIACTCWSVTTSRAQTSHELQSSQGQISDADKARYADALAYCRSNVPKPMALRSDKKIACFDGEIGVDLDLSSIESLETGGLFVVRSLKGDTITTIKIADLLLKKKATVIVNDYCLANCANYIFVASLMTFVPKSALVAWRHLGEHGECIVISETSEDGAPRFDAGACHGGFHDNGRNENIDQLKRKFYEDRAPFFAMPPESVAIRKALKGRLDATGAIPAVYWTWNPRFSGAIRTKVFYEAYPQSQNEVDALAARIGLRAGVIYDP